jgi:hypothetical protein
MSLASRLAISDFSNTTAKSGESALKMMTLVNIWPLDSFKNGTQMNAVLNRFCSGFLKKICVHLRFQRPKSKVSGR